MSVDDPVSAAMSAPAYTCTADQRAGEVLAEMFDRGLRHFPVLSATGQIVGVVEDVDLVALRTRSSFWLRQRIATARSDEELVTVSRELRPMVRVAVRCRRGRRQRDVGLRGVRRRADAAAAQAGAGPPRGRGRRVRVAGAGQPGAARGAARAPTSTAPSCGLRAVATARSRRAPQLLDLAREVIGGLRACGLRTDENGVTADAAPFVRSVSSWQHVAQSWMSDPTQDKALILTSVLVDNRPVWGVHTGHAGRPTPSAWPPAIPRLLRMLARFALSHRPAARRFRGLVVDQGGAHPGTLDLKAGGLVPIVDLARWGAMTAGVTSATTPERLRAAAEAGTLAPGRRPHAPGRLRARQQPPPRASGRADARRTAARRPRRSGGAQLVDARPAASGVPRRGHDPEAGGGGARRRTARGGRDSEMSDWRVFRPAIWLAMLGIALMLLLIAPVYIGAVFVGGRDRDRVAHRDGPAPDRPRHAPAATAPPPLSRRSAARGQGLSSAPAGAPSDAVT